MNYKTNLITEAKATLREIKSKQAELEREKRDIEKVLETLVGKAVPSAAGNGIHRRGQSAELMPKIADWAKHQDSFRNKEVCQEFGVPEGIAASAIRGLVLTGVIDASGPRRIGVSTTYRYRDAITLKPGEGVIS